ncbi:uncharacterized protein I303_108520 [Kwoniella dejecticola CBS 10117]|uniref:Uncharacterized protein n=1 Tax=Kwoniella dejecticola CBS 10117 TaxID=1296121 RepID=A0A1A5ZX64_9TREE|nr:uncharacterized protein I303_07156 [Kwoniella dejecticola CBS 10117]OBR82397.1 hypothetical protein I303_07156 [Kwoniella dejecticola CBS 10117]
MNHNTQWSDFTDPNTDISYKYNPYTGLYEPTDQGLVFANPANPQAQGGYSEYGAHNHQQRYGSGSEWSMQQPVGAYRDMNYAEPGIGSSAQPNAYNTGNYPYGGVLGPHSDAFQYDNLAPSEAGTLPASESAEPRGKCVRGGSATDCAAFWKADVSFEGKMSKRDTTAAPNRLGSILPVDQSTWKATGRIVDRTWEQRVRKKTATAAGRHISTRNGGSVDTSTLDSGQWSLDLTIKFRIPSTLSKVPAC